MLQAVHAARPARNLGQCPVDAALVLSSSSRTASSRGFWLLFVAVAVKCASSLTVEVLLHISSILSDFQMHLWEVYDIPTKRLRRMLNLLAYFS